MSEDDIEDLKNEIMQFGAGAHSTVGERSSASPGPGTHPTTSPAASGPAGSLTTSTRRGPSSASPAERSTVDTNVAEASSPALATGPSPGAGTSEAAPAGSPSPGSATSGPSPRTDTALRHCENGATWDGNKCVCPQGFSGPQCQSLLEFIFIDIPERINATLSLLLKVTYKNFTKDLENTSSEAYQDFMEFFKERMNEVYKDVLAYRGVNITRLLSGSIVVEHNVNLEVNYTLDYKKVFKKLVNIVRKKIVNETRKAVEDPDKCKDASVFCYSEEATTVSETPKLSFDPHEQCMRMAAEGFAQFYYVDELDEKLACVTNCTPGTRTQLNCHHGTCQLQRSGPRCVCLNTDTHWYWGETCERSTQKSLVYGIVGAVAGMLVLLVVTMTIYLSRMLRKLQREYKISQEWQKEVPGSFQNTRIWEDQGIKDKYSLESAYSHFQPSLKNMDPKKEVTQDVPLGWELSCATTPTLHH
ncbi:PREDICTED: mucin-12 [Elephantulus edwardii]|uniref:mucin-12 n=1 Tax=Elephantulus edwardii TaxID=28737 RepID=UPI0003F06811|nr:PREDICTED: mucin-12 [Elephantulus edwardii]